MNFSSFLYDSMNPFRVRLSISIPFSSQIEAWMFDGVQSFRAWWVVCVKNFSFSLRNVLWLSITHHWFITLYDVWPARLDRIGSRSSSEHMEIKQSSVYLEFFLKWIEMKLKLFPHPNRRVCKCLGCSGRLSHRHVMIMISSRTPRKTSAQWRKCPIRGRRGELNAKTRLSTRSDISKLQTIH